MKYDYITAGGRKVTQNTHYIFDTVFDPADDYRPWHVVTVYRDGNPREIDHFATEAEADELVPDLPVMDDLFSSYFAKGVQS